MFWHPLCLGVRVQVQRKAPVPNASAKRTKVGRNGYSEVVFATSGTDMELVIGQETRLGASRIVAMLFLRTTLGGQGSDSPLLVRRRFFFGVKADALSKHKK